MAPPNAFRTTGGQIVDLYEVISSASTPSFEPGTTVRGTNGSEYVYAKMASGVVAIGHVLVFNAANTASLSYKILVGDETGLMGRPVALAIASANSGDFCWIQRAGLHPSIRVDASACAAMWPAFIGSSAGTVSDLTATGTAIFIDGLLCLASGTLSTPVPAYLSYPRMNILYTTDATT